MADHDSNSQSEGPQPSVAYEAASPKPHLRSGIWTKDELAILQRHLPLYKKLKRSERTTYVKGHVIKDIKLWWKDRYSAGALKDKKRTKEWRKKKTVCHRMLVSVLNL